jgi:hypothetical protein
MDPSSSAMDLLYPRNLKNISNWRKSEYLLVMYDAKKIQKNKHLLVSTHLRRIQQAPRILFSNFHYCFLFGSDLLFLFLTSASIFIDTRATFFVNTGASKLLNTSATIFIYATTPTVAQNSFEVGL